MTDDVLDDPILDDRIRGAMHALADSHMPRASGPSARRSTGRRLLATVAALLVVGGVGALFFAGQRSGEERPVSTQAPAPIDSALPEPTAPEPTQPPPSPTPATDGFRFEAPLPTGILAVLDPAPRPAVSAYESGSSNGSFLAGRGGPEQIVVLTPDGFPEAAVSVTDVEFPIDTNVFDQSHAFDDGTELRWVGADAYQFYAVDGPAARELSVDPRTTENETSQFEDRLSLAIEATEFISGRTLDNLPRNSRFFPASSITSATSSVVTYSESEAEGSADSIQVVLIEAKRPVDADEFQILATLIGDVRDRLSPNSLVVEMIQSPQLQYVEQISDTQVVVINTDVGTGRDELDALTASLSFVDADVAGIDVESLDFYGDSIGQGEESWGRWEVYAPSDNGRGCYGFGASVWTPGQQNTSTGSGAGCPTADGTPPNLFCTTPGNDQVAGVYLGDGVIDFEHPSIARGIEGEAGDPIDGVGTPHPFLIDPAAGDERVSMLIDGEPLALPC